MAQQAMREIDLERWYSLLEAVKLTRINSREILTFHIRNGFLKAKKKGEGVGTRYLIRGDWIRDYNNMYEKLKQNKYHKFTLFKDAPINKKYEKVSTKSHRA
jgi:hypothetical protein